MNNINSNVKRNKILNLNLFYIKSYKGNNLRNKKFMEMFKDKENEEQLSLISGNLAHIYKSGIPIITALELIEDILSDKIYKNSILKVIELLKQGKSLSESFAKYQNIYPKFFVGIISIGEGTGNLYKVLKGLNMYYEKSIYIKREIRKATAYPLFVLISLIVLSIFLINNVIPSFFEIYKSLNIPLPATCKFLYDIKTTMSTHPFIILITIISWGLIILIVFKTFFKKISKDIFIKIKIVKAFYEYIMVLLLSIIISTGINISQGLEHCEKSISFNYLRKKIVEINESILNGRTLTESLEQCGIFSKYTMAIIKIREESGMIEEGFAELSNFLEDKLCEEIKKYLRLISPIFICIMAFFILLFLVVIVLPLFGNLKSGMR